MAPFDYYSAERQIAEYEKRRPKKYRNSGWKYCGIGDYRGAKHGRPLPETGYVYYTTQAWKVLEKCWLGYKIAKAQDDEDKMRYYAEGIRRAQKELGLHVESFPNLGMYGTGEVDSYPVPQNDHVEEAPCQYESEAQRRWRERMEHYYRP
jgi:hypothetical protein